MADHPNLYHRRCAEFGVDTEYRIGKLTFMCRLTANRKSAVCGALMLCDCGLFCKITMPMLTGLRDRSEPLPWECLTCRKWRYSLAKSAKSRRLRSLAKESRRSAPAPHVSLRSLYPGEYAAWKAARFGRKEPMCKGWCHRKAGFRNFLKDLGSRPVARARLTRRDTSRVHSKGNTYWRIPSPKTEPVEKFVLAFRPYALPPPPIKKNLLAAAGNGLEPGCPVEYPSLVNNPPTYQRATEATSDDQQCGDHSGHSRSDKDHPRQEHPHPDA